MKNWPEISSLDIKSLNEITLVLHIASQLVGATGKHLIAPEPDYSHTSMTWDMERSWFMGKVLPSKQVLHIALNVSDMQLLLVDEHKSSLYHFDLIGDTMEDALLWIQSVVSLYAINATDVKIEMEADIPDHPVRHGAQFPVLSPLDVDAFIKVRNMGAMVMTYFANGFPHASPVETWPHHFDTGTYIPLQKAGEEVTHSISLGMAVKDAYVDEPYFYVTHWKKEGDISYEKLPPLPAGGYWNRKDFTGAILKLSDVLAQNKSPKSQWEAIRLFMETAITASKQLLNI